nr:MAG TPA: hypothetical protein [Caudoviricetes sp.]
METTLLFYRVKAKRLEGTVSLVDTEGQSSFYIDIGGYLIVYARW